MELQDKFDSKELDTYFKHYTDLFIYQARQRLDAIRFFFVGFAILVTAVTSVNLTSEIRAVLLLAAGFVAIVFLRLDYRNAQIVELDEKPLKELQKFAMTRLGAGKSWQTFQRCDDEKIDFTTYGHLVPCLYGIAWLGSFGVASGEFHSFLVRHDSNCPHLYSIGLAVILIGIGLGATFSRPHVHAEPKDTR